MTIPRWPLRRELRLPLQIGTSALIEGAFDSGIGVTMGAFGLACLGAPGWIGWAGPIVGVLVAGLMLRLSWSALVGSRASDVVFGPTGLRVEGGSRHGLTLAWSAIDPARCRVEHDRVPQIRNVRGHQLIVGTNEGRDTLLAEVWQQGDVPALHVALDEIRAVFGLPSSAADKHAWAGRVERAAEAVAPIEQLRCHSCGVALAPRDDPKVSCESCGMQTEVRAELRTRLRAHAELERERAASSRLLTKILEQPGAAVANRWIGRALVVVFAIPILSAASYGALRAHGGRVDWMVAFVLLGVALVGAVAILCSLLLGRRIALRSSIIDLGARRGTDDDRPHCRACGGLLPDAALLVQCTYCDCDNLIGLDLRAWGRAVGVQRTSLRELLSERRQSLLKGWLAALVLVVIAALLAAEPLGHVLG